MKSPAPYIHHIVIRPGNAKRKRFSRGFQVRVRGVIGGSAFFGFGPGSPRTRLEALKAAIEYRNLVIFAAIASGDLSLPRVQQLRRVLARAA